MRTAALALLLLVTPGCGTYVSAEVARFRGVELRALSGVRLHLELYAEMPEVLLALPIVLPDLVGCALVDVCLLPMTLPPSLAARPASSPPPPRRGPAPPRPAVAPARPAPTRDEVVANARRVAPEDAALLDRLVGREYIVHREDGLVALPELTRMEIDRRLEVDPADGVAWAALGAAWARAGDLDRAEAYLRLGAALCVVPSNAGLARAELDRVVARRAAR